MFVTFGQKDQSVSVASFFEGQSYLIRV